MSRTKGSLNKHKKEKPIKEKKKRGRPSKQHQHQKQNQKQIVNVNVNGSGGGSKTTTIPVPFQLPSTIYDPSLITPYYGINDRQPVNPLTDAATDLMTPFIQSIISNQAQKVDKTPIPSNPKKPPQAISQDDVKPVNPVIPKPIEKYTPNPQTDQSHPIPPEIIMDSNISSSINLEKEIKPQMPKLPKPKKPINDPEGLGKTIPIQNIGALAGTIGAAALTGGATAAGEALLTGGTAGLMGAGESILGATIGSGVAAGASSALGNSHTANIISGIAGGIAGRAAGRAATNYRTRPQTTTEEQQALNAPVLGSALLNEQVPLLGNRLGGRRGRNRLVDNEIQQTYDPSTGETTQWQIPPRPSTIDVLKKVVNRKIKNINDGINKLTHQITGRNKTPQKGTYAQVPNVDDYEPPTTLKQIPTLKSRAQIKKDSDDLQLQKHKFDQNLEIALGRNELKDVFETDQRTKAASTIKKIAKRKNYEKGLEAMKSLLSKRIAARKIGAAMKGKQVQQEYLKENTVSKITQKALDDAMNEIVNENTAATTISSALRGHKGRGKHKLLSKYPQQAAQRVQDVSNIQPSTQMQTIPKTRTSRPTRYIPPHIDTPTQEQREASIRALLRQVETTEEPLYGLSQSSTKAATKIQKVIRGHQGRKEKIDRVLKNVSREKKMEAAVKKYNQIGDMMAARNERPMVLGETAPSRFIQSAARLRKKAFQSEISHVDTRVNLASKQEKEARIQRANLGIKRMDKIIEKKSQAGRPRTRSDQEVENSSRLSMLSTSSTRAAMTPNRK